MKETYKIKRPDHIVFGDPLYFEQFKGARLKKLVTDYHVLTKFDTARLVLEEKSFSNCPDMMNRTMTLYFAPEKHMDVYWALSPPMKGSSLSSCLYAGRAASL